MNLNGIEFDLEESNGKWMLKVKENMPVDEFKKILAMAKAIGGTYNRKDGFVFDSKPVFDMPTQPEAPAQPEAVEEKPAPTKKRGRKKADKPKTVTDIEKNYEESKKKDISDSEKKAIKRVEFEVFPVASIEECEEYLNAWKLALKNRTSEHQEMLDLLIEACKDDEELRQYITHKDYLTVFAKGGSEFCKKANRVENNMAEASATEILDDIITEFKKPVKKVITKKKEDKK